VRISGSAPAIEAAVPKIGGTPVADADAFWASVRDHTHRHFVSAVESGAALWRLSVKPTAPHRDLGGEQLIEWGGALRWLVAGARTQQPKCAQWAHGNGGHATLFRAADKSAGVFHPLPAPLPSVAPQAQGDVRSGRDPQSRPPLSRLLIRFGDRACRFHPRHARRA
jgi:glycolate oxidase FAD binding subunit